MNVSAVFRNSVAGTCLGIVLAFLGDVSAARAGDGLYLRFGGGFDASRDTLFLDEKCSQTQPPALFGCGPGEDGRRLGARGDFGSAPSFDAGIGYRFSPAWRAEALFSYHPDFDFSGEANFLNAGGHQPVAADLDTISALLLGYVDLVGLGLPPLGPFEPFIGAGAGISHHSIDNVRYAFPSLGANASTVTNGGSSSTFSFMLTVGASVALNERLSLDIAYRYMDLGSVEADAGPATITRASGVNRIDVAGTEAKLRTHGLAVSLRFSF